jgi:hypothetical protein
VLVGAGVAAGALAGDRRERTPAIAGFRPAVPVAASAAQRARPADGFVASRVFPTQLRIPSVGIRAAMVRLGVDRSGELEVPGDPATVGWYVGSSVPGDLGPSVIAGHVDSATGPAAFYRLAAVRRGATIDVLRSDGRMVRFRVGEVARYPKRRFPTQGVYGPTPERALRLVTCGGRYDARRGYLENVVVYATSLPR